jgi:hypothetical protein
MKTHMRMSIEGALRNKAFSAFTDENGQKMPRRLVQKALQYELAMGRKLMPVGKCDNFDPVEHGCLGHHDDNCPALNSLECNCGLIKRTSAGDK